VLGEQNARTDTRDALVREGLRCWSQFGWNAVGVQALLDQVGVPKGSFYHYFQSKEAFGLAVIEAFDRAISERLTFSLEGAGTGPDRLARFIAQGRERLVRHQYRRGCLLGNLGQELGGTDGALRDALERVLGQWEAALQRFLLAGIAAGDWPESLDAAAAARVFWLGWEGALLRAKLARSSQAIDDFEVAFTAMLAHGVPSLPPQR
jgi:TetR/AcrR family transcriptional repressor of nem operon